MGIPKELLSKWINYKNAIDKNIDHIKVYILCNIFAIYLE